MLPTSPRATSASTLDTALQALAMYVQSTAARDSPPKSPTHSRSQRGRIGWRDRGVRAVVDRVQVEGAESLLWPRERAEAVLLTHAAVCRVISRPLATQRQLCGHLQQVGERAVVSKKRSDRRPKRDREWSVDDMGRAMCTGLAQRSCGRAAGPTGRPAIYPSGRSRAFAACGGQ